MKTLRSLWKKDPGLFLSASAHVIALVFLLVNFERPPHFDDAAESIPVEMVTTSELNQVMNGEETAKQMSKPQRRVDKVADLEERHPAPPLAEAKTDTPPPPAPEKANDDPGHDDKPTPAAAAVPPPPTPTPPERPVEKTPPPPTLPQPPAQAAGAPTPPERPDDKPPPDAEAVAPKPPPRPKVPVKREAKKDARKPVKVAKVEPPPPVRPPVRPEPPNPEEPQPKPLDMVARLLDRLKPEELPKKQRAGNEAADQPHHDFSFDKITALLDHEAPQHRASTGRQLTQLASLGSPTSHAEKMSPSMMAQLDGWLIDHYRGCWSYFGLGATQDYVPAVRVKMAQDGSLMAKPALLNPPSDPNLRSLADSAVRAVNRCDPLPIPDRYKPYYNAWRDRIVRFDPKEMG
ncbi:MAG: cell envelope integrity protein TolA [Acetobacteraceae bacterium]|nr:cell envelope integrity protein TolA [Acetobacteraceae bacterium]